MQLIETIDATQMALPDRSADDQRAWGYVRNAAPCIANARCRMSLLDTGEHLLPVSSNDGDELHDNCYVVSPLTTYTRYAEFEIGRLHRPVLAAPLRGIAKLAGVILRHAQIDRVVQVNNWLLSTNLYPPEWHGHDLPRITRALSERFPTHAIAFRSLNRSSNPALIAALEAAGYLQVPSRQVYLFDGGRGVDSPFMKTVDTRKDARLLARTPYVQIPGEALGTEDFERLEHLYNLLYLEKYSPLNPHFSAAWLRAGQRGGWLRLTALRSPQGTIDAALGWFSNTAVFTTPMVGYDTALPQKTGLYRLISQISLEETARRHATLNMSAGAAGFKRNRGGQAEIESTYVFTRHLPRARQLGWQMLSSLLRTTAVPVMRHYGL